MTEVMDKPTVLVELPQPKSDADILAEAREYIEKHGWLRGELFMDGKVCSVGGIVWSQGWYHREDLDVRPKYLGDVARLANKVCAAIGIPQCVSTSNLVSWNDDEAEGEQEVLDAFAKAEKIERAGFDPDA